MKQPEIELLNGWTWEQRSYSSNTTNWAATSRSGTVWCDGHVIWDTCSEPIPVDVVCAVLKANVMS